MTAVEGKRVTGHMDNREVDEMSNATTVTRRATTRRTAGV
jgi:hypothetical protein